MKRQLELETLEERRHSLRLILLYKVVEGLVPVLWAVFLQGGLESLYGICTHDFV
jgi:hypothetical protein